MTRTFTFDNKNFIKDGKPIQIISGSIHYFRLHCEKWQDSLTKLRDLGCNTVSTSIPWNLHEPSEGKFYFKNNLDLDRFINTADNLGLNVILRPGPYICAEVDAGGLPFWLLHKTGGMIRCSEKVYLDAVEKYLTELFQILNQYTYANGGPLIMAQIENEYGAYGNDKKYMKFLYQLFRDYLGEIVLTTVDQARAHTLKNGAVNDALITALFGSQTKERLDSLVSVQPNRPQMCMEYWSGWFDSWGGNHHVRNSESTAKTLDEILKSGASVNLYMFHGGTNFGFISGAGLDSNNSYNPVVTSYDCDALLTESGEITHKYLECKKVLQRHLKLPKQESELPVPKEALEKRNITFPNRALLFDALPLFSKAVNSIYPRSMESLGQGYGFTLYRTHVEGPLEDVTLTIDGFADRAQIFINRNYQTTLYRGENETSTIIDIPSGGGQLDILVENMGRVFYGPHIGDPKGIYGKVLLGERVLFGWEIFSLPLSDIQTLSFEPDSSYDTEKEPTFYQASFSIEKKRDTYLSMDGWKKGVCFINGVNLGRYWKKGPQTTLYVPAPLLRKGKNDLVIFELHQPEDLSIEFVKKPDYGKNTQFKKSVLSRLFSRT